MNVIESELKVASFYFGDGSDTIDEGRLFSTKVNYFRKGTCHSVVNGFIIVNELVS
jgi:hypothetical protein